MQKQQIVAMLGFVWHDGKGLVVRRSAEDDFLAGYWEIPGGKIEWGEEPGDGLKREMKEESGLNIEAIKPYWVHDYVHEEEGRHIVEGVYICSVVGSDVVKLSHEHQDYCWIKEDELKELSPITDEMRKVIAKGFENIS